MKTPETKLIVGCGYLGLHVAKRWLADGHEVIALTRKPDRAAELEARGIHALVGDVADPLSLPSLPIVETALFAVGYDRTAEKSIDEVYVGGLRHVLGALPGEPQRFIYVSTTGVYGDAAGDEVDERTPPDPRRPGGKASLAAELIVASSAVGPRAVILRMAGLYGPGRIPYLAQLRAGEPIAAPSDGWLNLIYVEDAASVVVEIEGWLDRTPAETGPHVFCVSDGAPAVRRDYYAEAARLLGGPPPRFAAPATDSPAAARAAASRRVSNAKLTAALGSDFACPDYRAGLAQALAAVENDSR